MPETLFLGAKKIFWGGIVSGAGFFPSTVSSITAYNSSCLFVVVFLEK